MNWESAPNEKSTITLDPKKRDPIFGLPVVRLDWNLLESDKETVRKGLGLLKQYFAAQGSSGFDISTQLSGGPAHWTFDPTQQLPTAIQAGDHHMGAIRMSATPADGIVNPDLRMHSVDNLFVAGSSTYPSAGDPNPTLTIIALALRLADHLKGWKSPQ